MGGCRYRVLLYWYLFSEYRLFPFIIMITVVLNSGLVGHRGNAPSVPVELPDPSTGEKQSAVSN